MTVTGPKGTLVRELPTEMEIKQEGDTIVVTRPNKEDLPRVLGGLGTAIISTNHGVITDKEARKLNVGGEVLCFVW